MAEQVFGNINFLNDEYRRLAVKQPKNELSDKKNTRINLLGYHQSQKRFAAVHAVRKYYVTWHSKLSSYI